MGDELTHPNVDSLDDLEKSINQKLYSKSFSYTKHYGTLKTKYKILLVCWLLGTFIAFCHVLAGREAGNPADKMIPLALVALFSSRGVLLFLLLDVEIYHRLLNSATSTNLEMEMKGLSRARIHKNMLKSLYQHSQPLNPSSKFLKKIFFAIFPFKGKNDFDPVFYEGLFYAGICFCLWIVAGISISTYLYYQGYRFFSLFCGIATPLVSLVFSIRLVRRTLMSGVEELYWKALKHPSGNRK